MVFSSEYNIIVREFGLSISVKNNMHCSNSKDLMASSFMVNKVEAYVSQTRGISHLAAAVIMAYSSSKIAFCG